MVQLHAPTGMQSWTWCCSLPACASEQSWVTEARQQYCCTLYTGLIRKQLRIAPDLAQALPSSFCLVRVTLHALPQQTVPFLLLDIFLSWTPTESAPQLQAFFQWFRALLSLYGISDITAHAERLPSSLSPAMATLHFEFVTAICSLHVLATVSCNYAL